ncbi:DUF2845 domain-containing protein [Methylosarcina fibrata]|uniref:DUF2845 domain-containing protein n=1 Tax=Methylosarcina fibrata TaxID=105972 RepID=UPI0003691914|nr:DUF2845 domain-containing protein [Methylosarcina fibrata]
MVNKYPMLGILLIFLACSGISFGSSGSLGNSYSFGYTNPPYGVTSSPSGSTMRCGRKLVSIGDYKNDVYAVCGEPESIDTRTKLVGSTFHFPRRTIDIHDYEEVQVEEWVYNFGTKRFRKYLRFENGRLVEIRNLERSP